METGLDAAAAADADDNDDDDDDLHVNTSHNTAVELVGRCCSSLLIGSVGHGDANHFTALQPARSHQSPSPLATPAVAG